jgi:hypothetical protein
MRERVGGFAVPRFPGLCPCEHVLDRLCLPASAARCGHAARVEGICNGPQ